MELRPRPLANPLGAKAPDLGPRAPPRLGNPGPRQFAKAWGSDYNEIGEAGHINGDAGYGPWPEGEKLLLELCEEVQR